MTFLGLSASVRRPESRILSPCGLRRSARCRSVVSELVAAPASIGYETMVLGGAEARLRDPRGSTSSLKPGEEEDPMWTYLKSLLPGLEPESR